MKIASCEVQKFRLDHDKVLNYIYIIILYVHYNIVACRRTFARRDRMWTASNSAICRRVNLINFDP